MQVTNTKIFENLHEILSSHNPVTINTNEIIEKLQNLWLILEKNEKQSNLMNSLIKSKISLINHDNQAFQGLSHDLNHIHQDNESIRQDALKNSENLDNECKQFQNVRNTFNFMKS